MNESREEHSQTDEDPGIAVENAECKQDGDLLRVSREQLAILVREYAEAEILRQRKIDEELNRAKLVETIGRLAGGVAHEVRNPLNAIFTLTQVLFKQEEVRGNPKFEPYLDHIRTQVNRLSQLMKDLLELGKPISPANLTRLSPSAACRDAVAHWQSGNPADTPRILCAPENDSARFEVIADRSKLQQVILNLIESAVRHTQAEYVITLRVVDLPEGVVKILVVDQGTGVPPDMVERVFEPFNNARKAGAGLDLAIAKHLVDNMGGTVTLINNDPPPGCTVEVSLPAAGKEDR